jgi:hypothetical protein
MQLQEVVAAAEILVSMKRSHEAALGDNVLNTCAMKRALSLQSKNLHTRSMEPIPLRTVDMTAIDKQPGCHYVGVAPDNSVNVTINSPGRSRCSTTMGRCVRNFLTDVKGMNTAALLSSADCTGRIRKKVRCMILNCTHPTHFENG